MVTVIEVVLKEENDDIDVDAAALIWQESQRRKREATATAAAAANTKSSSASTSEHKEGQRSRDDNAEEENLLIIDLNDVPPQPPIPKIASRVREGASTSSQYAGVYFEKPKKWKAQISIDGKRRHIGRYDTEEEAAVDYARAVFKYKGEKELDKARTQKNKNLLVIDLNDVPPQQPIPKEGLIKEGSSKYVGVCFHKQSKKWVAGIRTDGKRRHIGAYDTEEEAAMDYARAVFKYTKRCAEGARNTKEHEALNNTLKRKRQSNNSEEGETSAQVKKVARNRQQQRYESIAEYECSADGCATHAFKDGGEMILCSIESCKNHANNGGVCITHGAKLGWNKERSSALNILSNRHGNGNEGASSAANEEVGEKERPIPYPDAHELVGGYPINYPIIRNPYLLHHFQVASPWSSYAHFYRGPFSRSCLPPPPPPPPQKHDYLRNNLTPLDVKVPHPLMLVSYPFGDEDDSSPGSATAAASSHSKKKPLPSALGKELMKTEHNEVEDFAAKSPGSATAAATRSYSKKKPLLPSAVDKEMMKTEHNEVEDFAARFPGSATAAATRSYSKKKPLLPSAVDKEMMKAEYNEVEDFAARFPGSATAAATGPYSKKKPPPSVAVVGAKGMKSKYHIVSPPICHRPNPTVKGVERTKVKRVDCNTFFKGMWEEKFQELLEFKKENGHCDVPQHYAKNPQLGTFVNKQRQEHKKLEDGKTSAMTDERLERLESIGFRWAKRRGKVAWDEKYDELLQYKAKYGNCHVPTKFKENTALGRWVSQQRAEFKKFQHGLESKMTVEKIIRLERIGFQWDMLI